MTDNIVDPEALERIKAAVWDRGFYAGQQYGRSCEMYNAQWDEVPDKPQNPYVKVKYD